MDLIIQEGKTQAIAILVALIAVSLVSEVVQKYLDPDRSARETVQNGIGLALTIVLWYFFYQGYPWARWVMGALLAMSGLATIPVASVAIRSSFIGPASLLVTAAVYLIASWVLLRSPAIEAFLLFGHA